MNYNMVLSLILILFLYGNYEINKNKIFLQKIEEKIYVKIISPNFELKYGLTDKDIEDRFRKLIRYSDPDKKKKTLFIWPEGVFSGYSFNEILVFKDLISNHFSQNHLIVFGTNKLNLKSVFGEGGSDFTKYEIQQKNSCPRYSFKTAWSLATPQSCCK